MILANFTLCKLFALLFKGVFTTKKICPVSKFYQMITTPEPPIDFYTHLGCKLLVLTRFQAGFEGYNPQWSFLSVGIYSFFITKAPRKF